ncbi:MAG: hypothetical protein A2046_09905 [Bacteroidetes bacterium GWA2_30_7]|nr:MAG: hypothetical protein A2046_09905 [Bacteroidetes bacterium GWA2_30_7]
MTKRTNLLIYPIVLIGCFILFNLGCKKDKTEEPTPTVTVPVLTTSTSSSITQTSANSGGNITSDGGGAITARGVCWSTSQTPTTANNKTTDGTGTGSFTSSISGLTANTTYYVRAYAINSAGTGYGSEVTFTTLQVGSIVVPVLTTTTVTDITKNSAAGGGNITNDGGASVTAKGVCWSTAQSPSTADNKTTDGTGTGSFTSSITGLSVYTTYYVRAFATNSAGTAYGTEVSFTTLQDVSVVVPTLTTTQITNITQTTATGGGDITSNGGASVTARGICWSTNQYPGITDNITSDGSGTGTFTSSLTGLTENTIYYVRAYATNSAGVAYGTQVNFKTQQTSGGNTVTDIDGNVYTTVTIGTQVWMAENLRVTKYRNGNPITNITDNTQWSNLADGAYSTYNNDANNAPVYGHLYNWFAVNDSRNIAPAGWHIPTKTEWTTLTTYLGGASVAGGKLKETGFIHWNSPNTGATNESGFTAVPNGSRYVNGSFYYLGILSNIWTATESTANATWLITMGSGYSYVDYTYDDKKLGFAVRCVKD